MTAFSKSSSSSLPTSGRNAKTFIIGAKDRSYTLTAAQAASAGAPLGSANYLYYRLFAVNRRGRSR